MALSLARMNPPCRVMFAGFESDTFSLGRNGWKIAFEEHHREYGMYSKLIMVLNHHSGLTGWAETLERFSAHDWRISGQYDERLPIFEVKQMSNKMPARVARGLNLDALRLADTDYSMSTVEDHDLARLPLFKRTSQPEKEDLIVDPATVSELLEQIRQRQAPMQKDIRDRARRREIVPVQHASIFTLPLAA